MDEVTQLNVAFVEEAAAQSLEDQTGTLPTAVAAFCLSGGSAVAALVGLRPWRLSSVRTRAVERELRRAACSRQTMLAWQLFSTAGAKTLPPFQKLSLSRLRLYPAYVHLSDESVAAHRASQARRVILKLISLLISGGAFQTRTGEIMALVKITARDIKIGTPIDFAVYSATGRLLLTRGYRVQSESQRERILAGGFRDLDMGRAEQFDAAGKLLISTGNHAAAAMDNSVGTSILAALPKTLDGLQVTLIGREDRPLRTEFVGAIRGDALILAPLSENEPMTIGVEVECKVLLGKKIYKFSSKVIGTSEAPVKLVYLAYPKVVQTHVVRKHVRLSTNLTGRLLRNDVVAAGFDAAVENVSLGGVALRLSDALLNVGEHFKLSLRLRADGKLHAVVFNCVARNTRRRADGAILVGAEFSSQSVETVALLRLHLFETATDSAG
jgi:hypothetical protein